MSYSINLPIPKNTDIFNPTEYQINLPPLVLETVDITFPTGCVGLVGIWFEYRASRLFPYNDGGFYTGNGTIVKFNAGIELAEAPNVLYIKGYNLDDTYEHKPQIVLDVRFIQKTITAQSLQESLFNLNGL